MLEASDRIRQFLDSTTRRLSGLVNPAGGPNLEQLRQAMMQSVLDCTPHHVRRVRTLVHKAGSANDLWLLRSEVYQAVTEQFDQLEAQRRVDRLSKAFGRHAPRERRSSLMR